MVCCSCTLPLEPDRAVWRLFYSVATTWQHLEDMLLFMASTHKGFIDDPGMDDWFMVLQHGGGTLMENRALVFVIRPGWLCDC